MYKVHRNIVDWYNKDMIYKRCESYIFSSYKSAYECYQMYQGKRAKFWINKTIYDCLITN